MATVQRIGSEILVNTTTYSDQWYPQITALDGGGFVVTWWDFSQQNGDTSGTSVRAQVFEADGGKFGSEILVNTTTNNFQVSPQITTLDGGGFVVTWADSSQQNGDTSSYSVRAQVFEADGDKIGSEILVNTTTNGHQDSPRITALDGGGFVVTWTDGSEQNGDTSRYSVRAQVFEADGDKFGSEILVNTTTEGFQDSPQITALDGDGFVVTWWDFSQQNGDISGYSVRAQVFGVNTPPTAVALSNATMSIVENTSTDTHIKVADIIVTDDGNGTNTLALIGTDASAFEIVGSELFLKAGVILDFENKSSYSVAVTVDDPSAGTAPDATSATYTLAIANVSGVTVQRIGSEILVNTTTQGWQESSLITALDGGGFVVTWADYSGQNGDISNWSVRAQVFDAEGDKIGSEILVNTTTDNGQTNPQITALDGGAFVVTWTDISGENGDPSGASVRAQVFDAEGDKIGSEILVNTTTNNDQTNPQITALDGGGFVVTWTDWSGLNGDTGSPSVRAQVFEADGDKLGSEIVVNTTINNEQINQQITALDGGGFVVTWEDNSWQNGDASGFSVRAQVFEADGDKIGSEILANTTTSYDQANPQITALDGGGFVVTWTDWSGQNGDTGSPSVRAQVFEADGDKIGSEIVVNTTINNEQINQKITALDGGGFVVTWEDNSWQNGDASGFSVRAQVFEADGDKIGSEILVNTTTDSDQYSPQIIALDGGGFVVTWTDVSQSGGDTSSLAVRAQVFGADGDKIGSEILVNTTTEDAQTSPQITALDGGGFVVTWTDGSGQNGDGSGTSVRAQVFGINVLVATDDSGDMLASAGPTLFDVVANDTPSGLSVTTIDSVAAASSAIAAIDKDDLVAAISGNQISLDLGADFDKLDVGETATVTVEYIVADPFGGTDKGTLTVTVNGVNDAPVAVDDTAAVNEDATVTGNVLTAGTADSDPDGNALSVSTILAGTTGTATAVNAIGDTVVTGDYGTLAIDANGNYSYSADADILDTLSPGPMSPEVFTYAASDGNGGTDTATLTINVTALADNASQKGSKGNDTLTGDTVRAETEDTLRGENGNDTLAGLGGSDHLYGGNGQDNLDGGAGIDWLYGEQGNDVLNGGAGDDFLTGGQGNDTFQFGLACGTDAVTDFKVGKDHIHLLDDLTLTSTSGVVSDVNGDSVLDTTLTLEDGDGVVQGTVLVLGVSNVADWSLLVA